MLLSKKKIQVIHNLFEVPYKPALINIAEQKEDTTKLSQIINPMNFSQKLKNNNINIEESLKKSSFPSYNIKNDSNDNNVNNIINNYDIQKPIDYHLKREIMINNPEEIIESGILKSQVKNEGISSIYDDIDQFKVNQVNKGVNIIPPEQSLDIQHNLENNQQIEDSAQNNIQNGEEPANEIDKIIPGPLTENVKLDEDDIEKVNETPVVEETVEKKYKIISGNIVTVPENYSTDDEEEYIAIKTLNEDVSSWKKYTDKNGIKLYFKPYPVKDEDGKDVESVIGYCEAILDFPASKVIPKMNNFDFRKNVDDQYKKGNLINERMEGNIKYMDMYLFMKMPFIFSDRDFVVRKKCWLDYNGNKDHALFYIHSIENPDYPPNKKLVRGNFANRSGYIKPLGDNKCQLNVVTAMDVKMSLGVSTMSKNGAEMQEKWINNLRKELAK